ncbi:MAG: hypothetical protein GXP15_14765 [Gammaproteobacteria bacterium]|nr:hypothetical protein [Gammaproteobacteria bacterium]
MEKIQLTASHWVFLLAVLSILLSVVFRKGVIIISIVATFILGLLSDGGGGGFFNQVIFSVQVVFKALLNAGSALFDIMLVVALMVAMLRSLQAQGADKIMVAPMMKLMAGPWSAFFVLATTMYIAAAFFWPTPAVALVGTVLIPVAMRVGLPAIAAAVSVNLAGHGMALSADPIIQGATRLTAGAAGIEPGELLPYTLLFSLVTGGVAISLACLTIRRDMRSGALVAPTEDEIDHLISTVSDQNSGALEEKNSSRYARVFAIAVPAILIGIALLMIYRALFNPAEAILGDSASALLGGTATIILVLSTFAAQGMRAMDGIADHTRDGFYFAVKIFAPIIPIAGFFFLGNPDHAVTVLGEGTPGFLFDIGHVVGSHADGNVVVLAFGVTLVGMLAGLDGSGFSGLPLIGSLSAALALGAGVKLPVLAALGQVVTIFTGGGTLVAWAFGACADAGMSGITPAALVRRNVMPVFSGLFVVTVLAIFLL